MNTPTTDPGPAINGSVLRAGLGPRFWGPVAAGAGLWTWLLVFPFFGPLLRAAFGGSAQVAGYTFAACHALGLLLLADPRRRNRLAPSCYAALPVLTLLAFLHPPLPLAVGLVALMGLASAGAVLRWLEATQRSARPGLVLAVAAGGANVFLWLLSLPGETPAAIRLPGDALVLVAVLILWYAQSAPPAAPAAASAPARGFASRVPPLPLLCFALAAYTAGGVMYGALQPAIDTQPLAQWLGVWPYILTFAPAAAGTRTAVVGRLLPWTLSTLGLGFVLLTAGRLLPWVLPMAWVLVMAGLGLADAYYWRRVIDLVTRRGTGTAALALAWNVLVVAGTSLATDSTQIAGLARLPLVGAAVAVFLFVVAPILTQETPSDGRAGRPAPSLTRSEQRVLHLLLEGKNDAEVAEELMVSRNTVKYHVRNVLRKTGCLNRRVLRATHGISPDPQGH